MKRLFKICISVCTALLLAVQMPVFTSCEDDLAAESYYTFTGEMMSDYLKNREEFSLFCRIVERAPEHRMDFLASRGKRTFFPPVNSGVEAYLAEMGYSSVEDIPATYCDTLVKACLVDETVLYTHDMASTLQLTNELDLPLILVTNESVVDANGMTVTVINSSCNIINSLKNDSVDNGVVHPVDRMLVPNTSVGASILEENHSEFEIFYEALRRTELLNIFGKFRDEDYDIWKEKYPESQDLRSGGRFNLATDKGNLYTAIRPEHLDAGFTVFVVRDTDLYDNYPEYFSPNNTMDENISAMYRLAVSLYDDESTGEIFGLDSVCDDGQTLKEKYWNETNLTSRYNPLNIFLSYHILDRLFESTDRFVNTWGINTNMINPTEWIGTSLEHSLLKIEQCWNMSHRPERPAGETPVPVNGDFYLNHSYATIYNGNKDVPGAHVTVPANNFSMNTAYYYIDRFIDYSAATRSEVMNTRMRIDMYTLFPELTNNNIRLAGNPWSLYSDTNPMDVGAASLNYYMPPGYLANTSVSENTTFFVMRPHNEWWNMGGDELNFLGSSYDITMRLPPVPPGNYELRMGYAGMVDRGIAQIYIDGDPAGIPVDLRYEASDSRVGGVYGNEYLNMTEEELEENNRTMKNNGYYRGPRSIYNYTGGKGAKYTRPQFVPGDCQTNDTEPHTFRRKLADVVIKPNTHHTMRFRSVWVQGNDIGCFMIDYIELVPYSICGPGGLGEDNY